VRFTLVAAANFNAQGTGQPPLAARACDFPLQLPLPRSLWAALRRRASGPAEPSFI